jgi:uncharacterized protein
MKDNTMIIDLDTHISPGADEFTLESLFEEMNEVGIDKALTWLSPHHYDEAKGVEISNRYVGGAASQYPDKVIGFGWADPTFGIQNAKDMATLCAEELGLHGVKMNGAQNNYYIDDPDVGLPLAEHIAKLGKMIAFHIGPDAYERTHPYRAAHIARLLPETTILMVHMGMTDVEMTRSVIDVAKQCPNMLLVGSATNDSFVLQAIKELGSKRVSFGTDRPFRKMAVIKSMYENGLEGEITESEMADVMAGNALRHFGLSAD